MTRKSTKPAKKPVAKKAAVKPKPKRAAPKRASASQDNAALKNNQIFSSGRGGARPGAGRVKGRPNKVTRELRGAAQQYSEDALKTLHNICQTGESESARVAAASAILDRAYGKPKQSVESDVTVKSTGMPDAPVSEGKQWLREALEDAGVDPNVILATYTPTEPS